jgi:hypothetical protein
MDRTNIHVLYGGVETTHLSKTKPTKTIKNYSPKDIDPQTETSINKLLKENRFLHKEINELKGKSSKDSLTIKKLQNIISSHNIAF